MFKEYIQTLIAKEISKITRYFDQTIQLEKMPHSHNILDLIDSPKKSIAQQIDQLPNFKEDQYKNTRTALLIDGNFNHSFDIQATLERLKEKSPRTTRIISIVYNPYFAWLYKFANRIGIRKGEIPQTFLTYNDLLNISRLAGFEIVRLRSIIYCPWKFFGIGRFLNWIMPSIPFFRWFGLAAVIVLRPIEPNIEKTRPSLSIVIPARNERGNIEPALIRMIDQQKILNTQIEIIFVEGHSNDQTWQEIERCQKLYSDRLKISSFQQSGKGKSDAVRLGFSKASCDLLTILDADLTMPPELLTRFYEAYCRGYGDFINGTRLVYPMEGEAMRFLNKLGNIFFAKALAAVLEAPIGDSLCGTKLVAKHDYERMIRWRKDFGEFDPFGDFELLFPASILALGIVDIPIRYQARTYGTTNIQRFRHGLMLLKMTWIGLIKIRTGSF